jgi:3-methyladenine DNA glycosylase Mpg
VDTLLSVLAAKRTDSDTVKTTVELPGELWRAAKIRAMDERADLRTVLIRALEPLDGVPTMRRRRTRIAKGRRTISTAELCRGPGNLTLAMGITLADNRQDLTGDRLFIEDRRVKIGKISWGPRIGIRVATERPWRAWLAGHGAVSRTRP